jgi:hypothetical protein
LKKQQSVLFTSFYGELLQQESGTCLQE